MNFIYMANGRVGFEILRWLAGRGDHPAAIVIHPQARARFRDEILSSTNLGPEHILEGSALRSAEGVAWLANHEPDWFVSVYFGYILNSQALGIPRNGAINLHPALLPFNRGAYPNVWSIVDHTPAGVTLHFMDPNVDTGDIIAQQEVPVYPIDTGAALYARLEEAALALFKEAWPAICTHTFHRKAQIGSGTLHRISDVARIDRIDPDEKMRAGDLVDIIRARTFPPYRGAYLDLGDRRIYLRLELTEEIIGGSED